MEPPAPTGVGRRGSRRWLRWLFILAAGIPLVAFGLSNLALGSPWGRDWIADKIRRRTTLETTIGGASWSPWNGVNFRDVVLQQPAALKDVVAEPLVRIPHFRFYPVWKAIFRGQPDVRSITLDSPRIVLPLEIVSYLATPTAPPVVQMAPPDEPLQPLPDLPPLAASPSEPASPEVSALQQAPLADTIRPAGESPVTAPSPEPSPSGAPSPSPTHPPVAAGPSEPSPPAKPPLPKPPEPPTAPTDFIQLTDASFAVVLAGAKTPLVELGGIKGAVPVAGKAGTSSLHVGSIESLGNQILAAAEIPLAWQPPRLSAAPLEAEVGGLNTKFSITFALIPGIPFTLEAIAPTQPLEATALPGGGTFKAVSASANLRAQGQLIFPSTWQADLVTGAVKPSVILSNEETKFDQSQSITLLRGGTLSCIDARIVGDQLSFLGNATVFSDGRAAGVLRIVAPPETTVSIVNQFFPALQAPPAFSAMSTPQRAALDLEVSGNLGDLQIRLGKNGPLVGPPKPPAPATPP